MRLLVLCMGFISLCAISATDVTNDPFLDEKLNTQNWEPGGEFFSNNFSNRGNVYDRFGEITREVTSSVRTGNILIQHAKAKGTFGYKIDVSYHHPLSQHGSFDVSDSDFGTYENDKDIALRQTSLDMAWNSSMIHPADAYDGGAGTGARDEFSTTITKGDIVGHYYNPEANKDTSKSTTISLLHRDIAGGTSNHAFVLLENEYGEKYYIGGGPSKTLSKDRDESDTGVGDYLAAYTAEFDDEGKVVNYQDSTSQLGDTPTRDFGLDDKTGKVGYQEITEKIEIGKFKDSKTNKEQTFLGKFVKAIPFVQAVNKTGIEYEAYWHGNNEGNSNSVAYQVVEALGYQRPNANWYAPGSGTVLNLK